MKLSYPIMFCLWSTRIRNKYTPVYALLSEKFLLNYRSGRILSV